MDLAKKKWDYTGHSMIRSQHIEQGYIWGSNNWLTLIVSTNNGVEAQNKVFKYEYLAPYKGKTVSGLMNCLLEFFQDKHRG